MRIVHYIEDEASDEEMTSMPNPKNSIQERARSAEAEQTTTNATQGSSKRQNQHDKMIDFLIYASEYASDGDQTMMEFTLSEAEFYANSAGLLNASFLRRVASIRARMSRTRDHHIRESEAIRHPNDACGLHPSLLRWLKALEVQTISNRIFHVRRMYKLLARAIASARFGDKERTRKAIKCAHIHARYAGMPDLVFRKHAETLSRKLKNSKTFHHRGMRK